MNHPHDHNEIPTDYSNMGHLGHKRTPTNHPYDYDDEGVIGGRFKQKRASVNHPYDSDEGMADEYTRQKHQYRQVQYSNQDQYSPQRNPDYSREKSSYIEKRTPDAEPKKKKGKGKGKGKKNKGPKGKPYKCRGSRCKGLGMKEFETEGRGINTRSGAGVDENGNPKKGKGWRAKRGVYVPHDHHMEDEL